ncbi:MAG: undecaprenyl diphosphate synthase family protein, partial [Sphingomonadaceae bacterium]|nr:undecaprenyl diphosphate synthase family protein [Sphingomonadaceae bacterium]
RAVRGLIADGVPPHEVTEAAIAARLDTADLPLPDLIIRTSGEQRLSNFLLWQAAYAELAFTDELWPDFNEASLQRLVDEFAQRERRYGGL